MSEQRGQRPAAGFGSHRRPVTRRDFLAQGLIAGTAMVLSPSLFGLLRKSDAAFAQTMECVLSGGSGDDDLQVIGGTGNVLAGGRGSDNLQGGSGDDRMSGGKGIDHFQFDLSTNQGTDTILDFDRRHDVLAFSGIPSLTRLTRAGMIDALASDYIRTARAKGLSRPSIVLKHALRNAAMPVVSIASVQLGFMLGGSIITETIFALHGVGYLAWESISKNDFPVVQAVVLVLALIYIGLTLLADLMNAVLDPRLRTA